MFIYIAISFFLFILTNHHVFAFVKTQRIHAFVLRPKLSDKFVLMQNLNYDGLSKLNYNSDFKSNSFVQNVIIFT